MKNNINREDIVSIYNSSTEIQNNHSYIIDEEELNANICIVIPDNFNVNFYLKRCKKNNIDVKFIQNNGSNLNFMFSCFDIADLNINVINEIHGSNNVTTIRGRVISKNNSIINVTGNVLEDTFNNVYTEDIKGLNVNDSDITVIPNLLVSSSEVIANHLVSIGNLSKQDIFYLTEKGISFNKASLMLIDAFLDGIFPKYIK